MSIDVAWSTTGAALITIPKADTTLLSIGPPEIRTYDINAFRGELMALHASEAGAPYSTPFIHAGEKTISGYTYARSLTILPPYRVMFETGSYVVQLAGGNHNILDVIVFSGVSVVTQNSAGLLIVSGGGVAIADVQAGLTAQGFTLGRAPLLDNLDAAVSSATAPTAAEVADAIWDEAAAAHIAAGSEGELLVGLAQMLAQQQAIIEELQIRLGIHPTIEVVHEPNRVRAPADGSRLDIQETTVGNKVTVKRL